MSARNQNPLSVAQIDADLFMADSAIRKSETISSKAGKHLRGLAGYHLQQAAEKMIKYQIYDSGITIVPMTRHRMPSAGWFRPCLMPTCRISQG